MANALRNGLRAMRQRLGLQQQDLASQIGVSRQTLTAIESGATSPSTLIALGLARALQCRVEDIFSLDDDRRLVEATFAADVTRKTKGTDADAGRKVRVAMGEVAGRWMARPLDGDPSMALGVPADGIATLAKRTGNKISVRPLRDFEALRRNLLVAGCDPALGLLGRHLEERLHGPRVHWIDLASHAALDELASERVHVAGLHLDDLAEGNLNAATVARRFQHRSMVLITLASWELGMVYRTSGGKAPRTVADLAGKGVRVVAREPGAGAQQLLESALKQAKLSLTDLSIVAVARGHRGVAQMVATGAGDVGIATRAAAVPLGLGFRPLAETRFDLAFPAELATDTRLQSLLDCLSTHRFRADLGAMTGYRTNKTGNTVESAAA